VEDKKNMGLVPERKGGERGGSFGTTSMRKNGYKNPVRIQTKGRHEKKSWLGRPGERNEVE